jgi:hypothetical protein
MPRSRGVGLCVHCQRYVNLYDKGLCWRCTSEPLIRDRILSVSSSGRRGSGLRVVRGRCPQPTSFLPGTPEKIEVMTQRAARGEELHHEDDPSDRVRRRVGRTVKPVSLCE